MATNIEEKVIEKLRGLPEAQQAEVLKFVEALAGLETKADNGNLAERLAIWDKIEVIMRDVPDGVWQTFRRTGQSMLTITFMVPPRSNHEDSLLFHPDEPVELQPNTRVQIVVTVKPTPEHKPKSFLQVAHSLRLQGPADWSSRLDD